MKVGLDLGTKTIVRATRDGDKPKFTKEINGFYSFDNPDTFTKQLLSKQKVPVIEKGGKIYALGSRAEKLAYAFNKTLKRPMAEGTISKEQEAINMMASIVKAILGKFDEDTIVYYCIPADALNKSTNVQYHDKVAKIILDSYDKSDVEVKAYSINEARAVAISRGDEVAIGISWGAGMVNVCYSMYGIPVFEFSLVGSGDWIDVETAKQFGYDPNNPDSDSQETPTTICRKKEEIDLEADYDKMDRVNQAITLHYQMLIENVVEGLINGFKKNIDKARIDQEIPIIMAGGTSSPPGFGEYFEKILRSKELPFEVSEVSVHDRPLYAVAEGCLIAAEMHEEDE